MTEKHKQINITDEEVFERWEQVETLVFKDFGDEIDIWGGSPKTQDVLDVLMKAYLGQLEEIPNA